MKAKKIKHKQLVNIDISDEMKIVSHGFDKWSFRKKPKERKRNRKKNTPNG